MGEHERSSGCSEGPCNVCGDPLVRCCELVRRAAATSAPEALSFFCDASWWTVHSLVRSQGYRGADAEDLTQAYFARFVEKGYLEEIREWRGCVRPFLRVSVRHFLSNERDRERAAKRGGGRPHVSLDGEDAPVPGPVDTVTP